MSKKPTTVLWDLEPHSRGKHLVLAQYLAGWIRIVGTGQNPLQVIDGFAGPGEYANGGHGSPIIMLQQALRAPPPRHGQSIGFHFMEEDAKRAAHLATVLQREFRTLPSHIKYSIDQRSFVALADFPVIAAGKLAPSFIMVDPFGVSQTPMRVLQQLMRSRSCEVYVSVMVDHVARFIADPKWEQRLNELFGCDEWKQAQDIESHQGRRWALQLIYEKQLRACGAKYVVSFNLSNEGVYKYTIFFGTSHPRGCGLMKDSIWSALGSHEYIASRPTGDPNQLALPMEVPVDERQPAWELAITMNYHFARQSVSVETLDAWIATDVDIYAPIHLRKALKMLEVAGCLIVHVPAGEKRRAGTFPPGKGFLIEFLPGRQVSRIR